MTKNTDELMLEHLGRILALVENALMYGHRVRDAITQGRLAELQDELDREENGGSDDDSQ